MDGICAIDLDTILPCYFISCFKKITRIYDAHEFFSELKEVIIRPGIKKFWKGIEKFAVPRFKNGYTVSESIAEEFKKQYGANYDAIRNVPRLQMFNNFKPDEQFLLYQGAVNEARGLEYLLPAMQMVDCKLVICGDGNFMEELKKLIKQHNLENKIELKGMLPPEDLMSYTLRAKVGISLLENLGLNQYLSLQNKYFDFINACIPQVSMNFPEYKKLNEKYEVAILIDNLDPKTIAAAINNCQQLYKTTTTLSLWKEFILHTYFIPVNSRTGKSL